MLRLLPALKIGEKVFVGEVGDTHRGLGVPDPPEAARGFVPEGDPKTFLTRKQAVGWMKKYDLPHMRKLPSKAFYIGLHSEHLAKAYGVEVKPVPKVQPAPEPTSAPKSTEPEKLDLSTKTAIVYDRGGLYLYCAEKLAEKFGKVMYYLADSDAYPTSQKHTIGAGLPKVKRIHDFWKYIDDADIVCFFDCYDGQLQHYLRDKGYKVFGSGLGEKVEIDKVYFLERLEKLGLPCPKTYLAEGMTDLCEYLEKSSGIKYLKNLHRGDFESRKFTSMAQSRPFLNDMKKRLGTASDTVEVLVQDRIDSECEVGWDGYQLNGQYCVNGMVGYELKDRGYVSKVVEEKPEILAKIDDAFSPEFKKLGYAGGYSTEVRITKDGIPYFIDATCRTPSPGGELQCELYENWAEMVWDLAHGKLPIPKPKAKCGAEIVLHSPWHEDHEIHVKFPKNIAECVKLKNHTKRDGEWYCIPNGNGGYFAGVVAYADTMEEAIKKVLEYAEQVEADELEYNPALFDQIEDSIKAGEKHGVKF